MPLNFCYAKIEIKPLNSSHFYIFPISKDNSQPARQIYKLFYASKASIEILNVSPNSQYCVWEASYLHSRIFKQSIIWVKHFLGKEEEPLPGHASIVQTLLSFKLNPQPETEQ